VTWGPDAAAGYDAVAESALGRALRARVHEAVDRYVVRGARVLDLGAGTGLDLAHYLEKGADVTGLELSDHMLEQARHRLGSSATLIRGDVREAQLPPGAFDVVVSDFGVLNCVDDLGDVGERIAQWCRPGGVVVLVVMGRWVPWEIVTALARAAPRAASRRWSGRCGEVTYWSPRDLDRSLVGLTRVSVEGLGIVLPTFEQRGFLEGRPRLLGSLGSTDRRLGRILGSLGVGDHWIGTWERR
jgi:SAM-dependent methyltransferase